MDRPLHISRQLAPPKRRNFLSSNDIGNASSTSSSARASLQPHPSSSSKEHPSSSSKEHPSSSSKEHPSSSSKEHPSSSSKEHPSSSSKEHPSSSSKEHPSSSSKEHPSSSSKEHPSSSSKEHPSSSSKDQNNTAEDKQDHTPIAMEAVHPAAEEEPTFSRLRCAIRSKDLYRWCATSGVLLSLQVIAAVAHSQFQVVPHLSVFCGLVLLLYSVALAATIYFLDLARPYAAYLLAIGSVLMTGQTAWYCDSFVALVKSEILLELPSLQNTALPKFFLGASPIDFLDTAMLFVILFQNCLQSSCLTRLGVRVTAIASVVQWVVIACWPLVSPNSFPA